MKTHYYLGWFNTFFPENLEKMLQKDLMDRKSLVLISTNPSPSEDDGSTERSWLDHADIKFDETHLINYRVSKEEAHSSIETASVIFLLGGDTIKQNAFLKEYDLANAIKNSSAVVIGASAGAINMSAKWVCSKNFGYPVETSAVYEGIGLHDFSVLSHFDLENNLAQVQDELSALSEELDVYASNKDCALRVQGDKIDILGDVYFVSPTGMQKLAETF